MIGRHSEQALGPWMQRFLNPNALFSPTAEEVDLKAETCGEQSGKQGRGAPTGLLLVTLSSFHYVSIRHYGSLQSAVNSALSNSTPSLSLKLLFSLVQLNLQLLAYFKNLFH